MLKAVGKFIFFVLLGVSSSFAQDQVRLGNAVVVNWWHGYETGAVLPSSELEKLTGFYSTFEILREFSQDPEVRQKIAAVHEQTGCELRLEINLLGSSYDRTSKKIRNKDGTLTRVSPEVTWMKYDSSWVLRGMGLNGKKLEIPVPLRSYPLQGYANEPAFEGPNSDGLKKSLDQFITKADSYNPKCIATLDIASQSDPSKDTSENEQTKDEVGDDNLDQNSTEQKIDPKVYETDSRLKKLKAELAQINKKIDDANLILKTIDKKTLEIAKEVRRTGKCPTTAAEYNYFKQVHGAWYRKGLYHATPIQELKSQNGKQTIFCGIQESHFSQTLDWYEGHVNVLDNGQIIESFYWAPNDSFNYYISTPQNDVYVYAEGTYNDQSYRQGGMVGDSVFFKIAEGFFSSANGFIIDKASMKKDGFFSNYLLFTPKFFESDFPEIAPTKELKLKRFEIERKIGERTEQIKKSFQR